MSTGTARMRVIVMEFGRFTILLGGSEDSEKNLGLYRHYAPPAEGGVVKGIAHGSEHSNFWHGKVFSIVGQ